MAKECGDESFRIPASLSRLQNLSYPLKCRTMNSVKLNQNIFEEISQFTNNDFRIITREMINVSTIAVIHYFS